jgi:hypothetical protein
MARCRTPFRIQRTGKTVLTTTATPAPIPTPTPTPTPTSVPRGDTTRLSASGKTKRDAIANAVESNIWDPDTTTWTIPGAQKATVSSLSGLAAQLNAFATADPTKKYEITLLASGSYAEEGICVDAGGYTAGAVFNTVAGGGCRVVAENGVVITGHAFRPSGRGISFYGVTFGSWHEDYNPGGGVFTNGRDFWNIELIVSPNGHVIQFDNCKFGGRNYPLKTDSDFLKFSCALKLQDCESAVVKNCEFNGNFRGVLMGGNRWSRVYNNDFKLVIGFPTNGYGDAQSVGTTHTWSGGSYVQIVANLDRSNTLDNASYYGTDVPHRDFYQHSAAAGYVTTNKLLTLIEDNVIFTKNTNSSLNAGGNKIVEDPELYISSDDSYAAPRDTVIFNNLSCSNGFLVSTDTPGVLWAECNTAGAPGKVRLGTDDLSGSWSNIRTSQGGASGTSTTYIYNNILNNITVSGGTVLQDSTNKIMRNTPSATAGMYPSDFFTGSFDNTTHPDGFWQWSAASLPDYTAAKDTLRNAVIIQMTQKPGVTAGAKFTYS